MAICVHKLRTYASHVWYASSTCMVLLARVYHDFHHRSECAQRTPPCCLFRHTYRLETVWGTWKPPLRHKRLHWTWKRSWQVRLAVVVFRGIGARHQPCPASPHPTPLRSRRLQTAAPWAWWPPCVACPLPWWAAPAAPTPWRPRPRWPAPLPAWAAQMQCRLTGWTPCPAAPLCTLP